MNGLTVIGYNIMSDVYTSTEWTSASVLARTRWSAVRQVRQMRHHVWISGNDSLHVQHSRENLRGQDAMQ
jgi:hypothetical protein